MAPTDPGSPAGRRARILIVDDHPIVAQGLAQLIGREPDLEAVACVADAAAALAAIAALKPDAAIIDLSLAGTSGLQLLKDCRERHPSLPLIVLSMHDETLYAERALRAGARGYVMKKEPPDRLLAALRRVLAGHIVLSDAMASRLLRGFAAGRPEPATSLLDRLSDREIEVFELLGRGAPTQQIAETLHLSPKTVETHRAHIKRKLQVKSATELLLHAMKWVQDEPPR